MTGSRKCDPVGAVEIADRLGVARRTVDQWRQRDLGFPEPRWRVGGRPAWNWDDIEAWAAQRSSLADSMQRVENYVETGNPSNHLRAARKR